MAISPPVFSVIVPTYNQANFLPAALDSLLAQTYSNWEAVIVNDGSSDDTPRVMEDYAARDSRFILVHKPNGGVASALNAGLRHARGEWICWLSSDDLFEPDKLAIHRQAILENPRIRFFYSHFYYLNDATGEKTASGLWQPIPEPAFQVSRFFVSPYIHGNSIAVHRTAFDKVGHFDEQNRCGQDFDMWLRISAQFESRFVDSRTCVTRFHEGQSGNVFPEAGFFDSSRACALFLNANDFSGIFPLLDLTSIDNALLAVQEILTIAFDGDALIYKCSPTPALLERLREWLVKPENLPVRNAITPWLHRTYDSITTSNLPDSIKQATANLLRNDRFTYSSHDFMAETALYAEWLRKAGKRGEAEKLERYLAETTKQKKDGKLRITVITPGTDLSGGVKVIFEYCNRLAKRGHTINLATMCGDYPGWFRLEPTVNFIKSDYDPQRLINDLPEADVVIATLWLTAYAVNNLPPDKGAKYYLVQSYESETLTTPEYADPTYKLPLRKLAVSSWLAQLMRDRFDEEAVLIRNAYDSEIFYPESLIRRDYPGDQIRVGMLYYPEERKGGADGITAFMLAREKHPDMKLILFGHRPTIPVTFDEIHENISGDDVRRYYNSLDLFMSTSWQEGFGLPGLEAMACGIPLVTTDSGGVRDYAINGETALVTPPRNPEAIADALIRLIDNGNLRERLRQNGLAKAAEFSWDASVTALETVLLEERTKPDSCGMPFDADTNVLRGRPSPSKPIKIAVFSLDAKDHACGHYRIQAPFRVLTCDVELSWGIEFRDNTYHAVPGAAEAADIIVVQRFFPRPETAEALEYLYSLDKPLIFEIDDLIIRLPETNPHRNWGDQSAPHILELVRKCSAITVSTEELKKYFSQYNATVHVLPNLLDEDLWHRTVPPSAGPVVIGYAGTATHGTDLALLEDVLGRIASQYESRVAFTFMGCATEKISRLPGFSYIPFETTFAAYAGKLQETPVDIMLVPLEDNEFNRCKSNVKWLEYSACGIAGIYADLPPYNSCITQGETGILVGNTPQQWFSAIDLLVRNPELRRSIARKARQKVMSDCTLKSGAQRWLEVYRDIAAKAGDKRDTAPAAKRSARVSIIIPAFNQLPFTRQCLDGLFATLPDTTPCEIIVVDNGSTDGTPEYLRNMADRVTTVSNRENLGFARACNQGARTASGDILLFLNNDTIPRPAWLEALLSPIDGNEADICGARLLYPDGRCQHAGIAFDERGLGYHIFCGFPGDAAPVVERRRMQAVTGACMAIRKSLFHELGGFDEGFLNGFEDVDLCLRAGEGGRRILFVPESVLVHHTERSSGRKDHEIENLQRFFSRWLDRIRQDDTPLYARFGLESRREPDGSLKVYPVDGNVPPVSIIIPLYSRVELTRACLLALERSTDRGCYELVLVDNGSSDGTSNLLREWESKAVIIRNPENRGFAAACNQGARAARGKYLLFLNNDTEVTDGWLKSLTAILDDDPTVAAVGAKLLFPDGTVQHAGIMIVDDRAKGDPLVGRNHLSSVPGDHPYANKLMRMQAVTAACVLIRRTAFEAVGGFDEGYWNGYEDLDLCFRFGEQEWKIVYQPASVIIHHESKSGPERYLRAKDNIRRLHERWLGRIRPDMIIMPDTRVIEGAAMLEGPTGTYEPHTGSRSPFHRAYQNAPAGKTE